MGAPFTIILWAPDAAKAETVASEAFKLVDDLVDVFSDYTDSSELNRLCAHAGEPDYFFHCSPELFDILATASAAFKRSRGSFDVTLGPLTRLWRTARRTKQFPGPALVKEKLALTGFNKLSLDTLRHGVALTQAGMQLDLGGIAQGYIAQRVISLLLDRHINNALVDVSGDIACIGHPPGKAGWTVAINIPESKQGWLPRHLEIGNMAVTTSGDVYQYLEHGGKRYSHIIDPATGYGITTQRNVTVIARDGTTADWLTKACSILPLAQAKKLAAGLQAEVLIAEIKKGKLVYHSSPGFDAYWQKREH